MIKTMNRDWDNEEDMGAVYKKKKRSCPMCKPHKMGWDKKNNLKYRQLAAEAEEMIEEALEREEQDED